jgi:hypothetical protein
MNQWSTAAAFNKIEKFSLSILYVGIPDDFALTDLLKCNELLMLLFSASINGSRSYETQCKGIWPEWLINHAKFCVDQVN